MSQYADRPTGSSPDYRDPSAWVGWITFAGMILIMVGIFHIIQGFVALFQDSYFAVPNSQLVVHVSYTGWGWAHIIGGLIVLLAGFGVLSGRMWARAVGTLVALLSAIVNVAFLSAYPIWSIMMIALDVVIIMALTVHGSEIKQV
jgi:hypothetical protein